MNILNIDELIIKMNSSYVWDEEPVFCFTSDVDWASEEVLKEYFSVINGYKIRPTLFVTHSSSVIEENFMANRIDRGIHPNFMAGSSHGETYKEVIETCIRFAPESFGFRSHRAYDVTDITHLLQEHYGYKYVSNQITVLQQFVRPILHESGLINFPVFFEDGTHLYNRLDLRFEKYLSLFESPGLKIISFHPMNFVFNSPTMKFMRTIKDSLSRKEYNSISKKTIDKLKNREDGIGKTVIDIINYVLRKGFKVMSMNEMYNFINIQEHENVRNRQAFVKTC